MKIIKKPGSINVTTVGNPTISDDYIVSNFGVNSYVYTTSIDLNANDSWVAQVKVKRNGAVSSGTQNAIRFHDSNNDFFGQIGWSTGQNKWWVWFCSFDVGMTSGYSDYNVWYWFRMIYSNNTLTVTLSTTGAFAGEEVIMLPTRNVSDYKIVKKIIFGSSAGNIQYPEYLNGEIDINECWFKINGNIAWQGVTPTKYYAIKEENLNVTVIGDPTISNDYIVSNFSASNKLGLPITLDPSQPYEIQIKFKLNYLNDRNGLIGVSTSGIFCVRVFSDNTLNFLLGNTIDDFNIGNISGNTVLSSNIDYWTKCVFTGTSYAIYLSTNGINWNLENSINSSTPANNGNPLTLYLGDVHSNNWYLKGSMDLKECYIESNNNIVWQGVEMKYYGIGDTLP